MPDSQKHRPGVSVKLSPAEKASKLLKQAGDLEQKLLANPEGRNEKLVAKLSEVFGDIIMSNPLEAKNHDVVGRLWNTCFYSKVKGYRSKISRAKRKKDPEVKNLKKQFAIFVDEAIQLYDYLVNHCRAKIRHGNSESQTQDSEPDSVTEGISKSLEGIVECLFKIYIHTGDLYRYAEKFKKAEECYFAAARLGPGKGNPYNQLAVVTLTQDPAMSCNALYWYVRSILATHQAFGTTPGNLERLFDDNMTYLNEHSRESKPPILNLEQKRKGPSKDHSELLRAKKKQANKSFLAHFVAVLREVVNSTNSDVDEDAVRSKMSGIMDSFESLLRATTFGDSMLNKIVLICVYAYERSRSSESAAVSRALSLDYLLMIGVALATRLETSMTKLLDKDKAQGTFTIRLLLPYLILCEYMSQIEESGGEWHDSFWKSFCKVANLILQVSRREGAAPNSYLLDEDVNVPLSEYQLLKGYRPFAFLHKSYAEGDAYLSPEEAVNALDLVERQERARSKAGEENKTKLSRFSFVCQEYAKNEKIPVAFSDDRYSYGEETLQEEHEDEPVDGGDFTGSALEVSDDDDAGDVVLFRAEEEGGAEAPFVPGAPDKPTMNQAPQPLATSRNEGVVDIGGSGTAPVVPAAVTLQPEQALLPPPGFTVPMASPVNNQIRNPLPPVPAQQYPHHGVYGQVVQGHQMLPTPPPPGMVLPGTTPLQGVPVSGINGNLPFGHAWQVFGGSSTSMQTANPFASAPPAIGFGHAKPAIPIFEDQHITTEGTSLLDSALIDSLFMNDTKTNNPWK